MPRHTAFTNLNATDIPVATLSRQGVSPAPHDVLAARTRPTHLLHLEPPGETPQQLPLVEQSLWKLCSAGVLKNSTAVKNAT
ncbi:hypothetical protein Taro_038306 [Colocasia esculenta]|uniref:Uncharacterized protein n=1 Tax=Colocasia esculenta TaxID=4460 RepID=A0A843WCE7_COLES|nr:hypothetical protein [Colocasia esculenta]